MIVVCPSCSTPWQRPGASAATARCGHCEQCFQMREVRRPYRLGSSEVRPTAFGVARLPIGMDDPRLAAQLAESASERPSGKDTVLTYRVVPVSASEALGGVAKCADDERTVTRPYWETDAGATDSTDGSGLPAADELATPEEATAIASAAEPVVAAGPRFRAVLLPTVAPLAVGMGLAYALASWGQNDPMDWTILGGALGLLVGLLCQRWARRRAD